MADEIYSAMFEDPSFVTSPAFSAFLADPSLPNVRRYTLANGATVHEATAPALYVNFIQRGQVRLFQEDAAGNSRLCEILGPGQWFGAAAMAKYPTYGLRAVAVGMTVITEVAVDTLLTALAKRSDLLLELNRQLAAKVSAIRADAAELIFSDTTARLLNALLRFSRTAAAITNEDGSVTLSLTHSQLAQAVGAARETISLALTQLRHQNLVKTGRNQLIFNRDELVRFRDGLPSSTPINRVA